MSDLWQWIYNRRYQANEAQDETRIEMVNLFWQMMDNIRSNPELSLHYAEQSRQLAELVDDIWFVQLINHWELQIRFSFLGDYSETLNLATKATVAVRLPAYQDFPQRICLHEDLITAYVEQDPVGNKDLVQQALDYMETEVDPKAECYKCLFGLKIDFLRVNGTLEETLEVAHKTLGISEDSPHHLMFTYLSMAEIAYQQGDWENLNLWAKESELNARKNKRDDVISTALLWLATYAQHNQEPEKVKSLHQQATHIAERYGAFIGQPYYLALTIYHETSGQLEDALLTQQDYLMLIEGKSKPFQECTTLLNIIRLKKSINQVFVSDIETLKERVKVLKVPNYILDQLEDIINKD
jgi:hypothetical protein